MKIGMIFPGQGSQFLGMGKKFYDEERIVQEYFDEATACLERNFVRLCFASSDQDLINTANAQAAIFVVSASIFALLREKFDIRPNLVAGNSLGEYSAIFAAGGLTFPDALYLLNKRAFFMDEATKQHNGGMLAIVGLPYDKVEKICSQYDRPGSLEHVAQIVNFNSPTQVVVSGTRPELLQIKNAAETFGARAIMLRVAGAFHSRLMKQAEERFSQYLTKVDFSPLKCPLVNNVAAVCISSAREIQSALVMQTSSPILWWQSMEKFKDCDLIIEIGPGRTFSRIIKREWPEKNVVAINTPSDLDQLNFLLKTLNPFIL